MSLRPLAALAAFGLALAPTVAAANTCEPPRPRTEVIPMTGLGTECPVQLALPADDHPGDPALAVYVIDGDDTPLPITVQELAPTVGSHTTQSDPCGAATPQTKDVTYRVFELTPEAAWPASATLEVLWGDETPRLVHFDTAASAAACPAAPDWDADARLDTLCQAGASPGQCTPDPEPSQDASDDGCAGGASHGASLALTALLSAGYLVTRRRLG